MYLFLLRGKSHRKLLLLLFEALCDLMLPSSHRSVLNFFLLLFFKMKHMGLPWWSSG